MPDALALLLTEMDWGQYLPHFSKQDRDALPDALADSWEYAFREMRANRGEVVTGL